MGDRPWSEAPHAGADHDGPMRWLLIVLLSGVLGVATAASDVLAGDRHTPGPWQALAVVLNAGSVWAGLAVVCGVLARRAVAAGIAAVAGLAIAVLGYYGYAVLLGDRMDLGFSAVRGSIEYWLVAAAVLGPLLGVTGALARRADAVGLVAGWVLPAGIALEVLGLRGFTPGCPARRTRRGGGRGRAGDARGVTGLDRAAAGGGRWVSVGVSPTRTAPSPPPVRRRGHPSTACSG